MGCVPDILHHALQVRYIIGGEFICRQYLVNLALDLVFQRHADLLLAVDCHICVIERIQFGNLKQRIVGSGRRKVYLDLVYKGVVHHAVFDVLLVLKFLGNHS